MSTPEVLSTFRTVLSDVMVAETILAMHGVVGEEMIFSLTQTDDGGEEVVLLTRSQIESLHNLVRGH